MLLMAFYKRISFQIYFKVKTGLGEAMDGIGDDLIKKTNDNEK